MYQTCIGDLCAFKVELLKVGQSFEPLKSGVSDSRVIDG